MDALGPKGEVEDDVVQTGSGAHPVSYPIDTGGSFPGGKAARAWCSPLTCS
jgi:hypothetical protein